MFAILSLLVLASQALAFNITLGTQVLQSTEILNFTPSGAIEACANNCTMAQNVLTGCADVGSCLCSDNTATWLLNCQQCMFTQLIASNQPMPDVRAGSQPLLGAYAQSCTAQANVNLTKTQTSLALPPFWDGPAGIHLDTGSTAVAVIIGTLMTGTSIYLLSNM
ncbi:hypothetical protein BDZ89DRAFT_1147390 [Hymenopellis radicata]|nr:hypothetical protein BDZ89DRAFT_1147390 [Hymenopellis radicata]